MRGKTRAFTRYNKFKNDMFLKFQDDSSKMSDFISYLRVPTSFDAHLKTWCNEDESLKFEVQGVPISVFQLLRIADKPILLRELENFGESTWGKQNGKKYIYAALTLLYSINLVDYKFRDFNSTPSNVVQFFVKEED